MTTALEVENLVEVTDPKMIATITKFQTIREQKRALEATLKEMNTDILAYMSEHGADALVVHGKVQARRQQPESVRLQGDELKKQMPAIWAKFSKVTKTVRLWVA